MSAVGNFQMYIASRMANDLNQCPHCGGSPVRIIMAPGYGGERYECATEGCKNYSRQLSLSYEEPAAETQTDLERPRPQWLWVTHHHDFG